MKDDELRWYLSVVCLSHVVLLILYPIDLFFKQSGIFGQRPFLGFGLPAAQLVQLERARGAQKGVEQPDTRGRAR